MSKLMRMAVVAGALACTMAATATAAVVTTFTSRAAFEGALSGVQTFDFNGSVGPVSTLGSALTVSTQGGDSSAMPISNALCGSSGGGVDCFKPLVFTFAQPGHAFGYDNLDLNGVEEAVVILSFASGDPDQTFVFDLGGAPIFSPIFFGVVADQDLTSVTIYSRDPGTTNVGARANVVDNVTVGSFAVPAPGTGLLFGTALLGLLAVRRGRLTV